MARRKGWLEGIASLPWWVGALAAVFVYAVLRFIPPLIVGTATMGQAIGKAISQNAYIPALAIALAAAFAFVKQVLRGRVLDRQTGIESIRSLRWDQFEQLVHEAFRRDGFFVEERGGAGPDGGVDLVLRKDGERILVQCKHWRSTKVGVREVRELFGVQAAQRAASSMLVTTGTFTREAEAFAAGKPITLLDGHRTAALVKKAKAREQGAVAPTGALTFPPPSQDERGDVSPACPRCGKGMVRRVAAQGSNAGKAFWGCSAFPTCRGTRAA